MRQIQFTFQGAEGEINFNPALRVEENSRIRLNLLTFPNYIYNIHPDNNEVSVTYMGTTYTRNIPTGVYSNMALMNDTLNTLFYPELPVNWVVIGTNGSSYKVGFMLLDGVTLDLKNLGKFFGFSNGVLVGTTEMTSSVVDGVLVNAVTNKLYTADQFPDMSNGVDVVYIRCNLVKTQFNNDKYSEILEIMPFTGNTGDLISYTQENLSNVAKPMKTNVVNSAKISLGDKAGNLLYFGSGLNDYTTVVLIIE